ncbi:DUF2156 domain-containing protein [Candidatus Saccharibacteria bacterium]|nr:DUF2156 domain-containing protein [Candidatus Saccharibacteria bacterium]
MKKQSILASIATIALFFVSTSWLAGPFLNNVLAPGPNLISFYEANGMPYASLFRVFDVVAALLLIAIAAWQQRSPTNSIDRHATWLVYAIGGLQLFDAIVPVSCTVTEYVCRPDVGVLLTVHRVESIIVMILAFGVVAWRSLGDRSLRWVSITLVLLGVVATLATQLAPQWLFSIQAVAMCLTTYGLWYILLGHHFGFSRQHSVRSPRFVVGTLTFVVIMSALFNLGNTLVRFVHHQHHQGHFLFSLNNSWLAGHGLLVTLAMLYVTRNFWQGSLSAWRVVTVLSITEAIRYAALGFAYPITALYLLLFCTLLLSRSSFTLHHSLGRFRTRLLYAVRIVAITSGIVTALSIAFRYGTTRKLELDNTGASHIISKTLLLEPVTGQSSSHRLKLFDRSLNMIGGFMYLWLLAGLFLPRKLAPTEDRALNREQVALLLSKYSTSSEDYFKLWPKDKEYWFDETGQGAVAYAQSAGYFIALANPMCSPRSVPSYLRSFREYAHTQGAKPVWLLIGQPNVTPFEQAGYRLLPIGSSAIIAVQTFATETVKNKWWRWKTNKAIKASLTYERLTPPHTTKLLDQLGTISEQWLRRGGHEERGFALGHFDASELAGQTLHVLRNQRQDIIAFANQLPHYAEIDCRTIDLMRFLPEAADAMAFLLREIICAQAQENAASYFDLGFVPLAGLNTKGIGSATMQVLRTALTPIFSSHGLEQFKSKFAPVWHTNFIAFDGDRLDAPIMLSAVVSATRLKK